MPPSSNNCYKTIKAKGHMMRVLTTEASTFKKRVLSEVVTKHLADITKLDKTAIYDVTYRFYFAVADVLTKSFGAAKNGAKSQYKRMDLENRLKLISDVISDGIGIDDSQFFAGHQEKRSCLGIGGLPQVHVFLRKRQLEEFGF